ncbi:MAG: PSD1 and planctomycete cytochrome C domain-containing protein [Planctomycetota bacterium]|nr:PSD1 and planctomycete cytochrome C domain-containing protein [Planctomycetota bacterium]
MIRSHTRLLVLAVISLSPFAARGQENIPPVELEFFEKKIRPILVQKCYECHSAKAEEVKGGLLLDTRDGIRKGGETGHAVVPGDVQESLLIDSIRHESIEMPPEEKLSDEVIADFVKWVRMGAPDPRDGDSRTAKREIDFAEGSKHWAFQPVAKVAVPTPQQNANWARTDIDRFVAAKLDEQGLRPVAGADRLTLIRRLYYDLIGLPPTPEELSAVANDSSDQAIAKLVDQLLESPRFGERWGRHWLDVVRYAESNGRERNYIYPHAWRYRDYVIASFNADKPFDQFIREQIAGDLLPNASDEQRIATGLLALGPKLLNERDREIFVMDMVDEQVDITTRAFMAFTASCARCHDHKFDPIPMQEYYSLAGIFRSTKTLYGTANTQGNRQASQLISLNVSQSPGIAPAEAAEPEQAEVVDNTKQAAAARKRLAALQAQNKKLAKQIAQAKEGDATALEKLQKQQAELRETIAAARQGLPKQPTPPTNAKKGKAKSQPTGPLAMGVEEGKVENCPIYLRGETDKSSGIAERGFLTILDPQLKQPILKTEQSGRLEYADWIVSPENPMTSRVLANRVWQHLFGEGIVRTVDNFGMGGELPSHPELLDYLAGRVIANEWSVKKLIREMVLSRAYQLSAEHDAKNFEVDPTNLNLWRHDTRRADAESLRDAILFAGGKLDVTPPDGSTVTKLGDGEYGRGGSAQDLAADDNHRSVYLPILRNAVPEVLQLFDFAEPSMLVGQRQITNVPTQALYLMNSDFVTENSDALAARLLGDAKLDDEGRVDKTFQLVLSRPASDTEIERALAFIQRAADAMKAAKPNDDKLTLHAWSGFCQALFGSAEFRYID